MARTESGYKISKSGKVRTEVSGFCWSTRASLCEPLRAAQISVGSATTTRASPAAGTAPDKDPSLKGTPPPSGRGPPLGNGCDGKEELGTAATERIGGG